MSTDKHFEFGSQTSNMTSANPAAGYGRTLMADDASGGSADGGSHQMDGGDAQMTDDSGGDRPPVWQMAGKALIILLVIFGLVLGGRWVWSNYSGDDGNGEATPTETAPEPQPLPINDVVDETANEPEPIAVGDDIPALGPANPVVMTIGAAILAATLYRFSNLAHQSNRR